MGFAVMERRAVDAAGAIVGKREAARHVRLAEGVAGGLCGFDAYSTASSKSGNDL